MKYQFVIGIAASAVLAAGPAFAQSTPDPQTSGQTPAAQSSPSSSDWNRSDNSAKTVTLTGCLTTADKAGTMGSTGTSGMGSGSPSSSDRFVLTDVSFGPTSSSPSSSVESPSSSSSATGSTTGSSTGSTSGTSGAYGSTGSASGTSGAAGGYLLTGKADDLRKYVGQRVEVRGKLDNKQGSMGSSSSEPSSSSSASSSSSSDTSNLPKLHVQSVRAIGGSCAGGQR